MAKIVKTLRNNWKKSVVGFAAVSYGIVYAKNKYYASIYMQQCCEHAMTFGDISLPVRTKPRKVTVFLNPAANGRKARKQYEQFCAPLFHLAGLRVDVISTESEGQVRTFLETFDGDSDAIVVAGGDGTLSEAVTGMLRRSDTSLEVKNYPIGVLPLGKTNTIAHALYAPNGSSSNDAIHLMATATMAVIHEVSKPIDVVKIQVLQEDESDTPSKPVYCVNGIQWGAYRDALARQDKYWYWNKLRSYVTYIFTGFKDDNQVSWKCNAQLNYTLPCSGCSNCCKNIYQEINVKPASRWWQMFLPRTTLNKPVEKPVVDYKTIVNEECGKLYHKDISTIELAVSSTNCQSDCSEKPEPYIEVSLGPETIGYIDFVGEGWRRVRGKEPTVESKLLVREIEIMPVLEPQTNGPEGTQKWLSIDLEEYEVKPIHITLLPKRVRVFSLPQILNT